MEPARSSFDPDALLAHASWVRALARSLVPGDPHRADDVAQEACLAALEREPRTDRPLGAWLAAVVKNLVRQERRGAGRRSARERSAAKSEGLPSTSDHVARLSVHRALVEAVMELDEPYRETIVLRFFEELAPTAIAERQRVPIATVKTRLARALEKLRASLDRKHGGDGRSWQLALLPLTRFSNGVSASTLGVFLVPTNLKLAFGAVLVACCLLAVWYSRADAPTEAKSPPTVATSSATPDTERRATDAPATIEAPPPERRESVATATTPAPKVAPAAPSVHLLGRVLDVTQRARAGLRVCFRAGRREISAREFDVPARGLPADAPTTTTDAAGAFELPLPASEGELLVVDPDWTTVLSSLCGPGSSTSERVILVAPHLEHAGRVVDESGRGLAGARIEIQLPRDLRRSFSNILDSSAERSWIVESDETGRFEFTDAPRVEGAILGVSLGGYGSLSQAAPDVSERALELVLRRPALEHGRLAGQVVDARGEPVAAAHVTLGHTAAAFSDEQGFFSIEPPKDGARDPWIAVKEGHQPALEPASAAVKSGDADSAEFVVLRLGPPPLTIRGRVVDEDGKARSGVKVFVTDPTFFGAFDEVPMHVEGMLSGAATRADLEKLMADAPEHSDYEDILSGTSSVFWTFARTDASGAFELQGLLDRVYHVSAVDPETLLRIEAEPIPAGTHDAKLQFARGACLENVRGRVVTSSGKPVAGVKLVPNLDVLTVHLDEHSWSTFSLPATTVFTDAEGRFAFARLPRANVYLQLTGDDIVPLEWARGEPGGIEAAAGKELDEIVIPVDLRYHLQVEVAPDVADELRVLDERGHTTAINVFEGTSRMSTDVIELVGGRSKVMVVGSEARTLVLSKGGKEVSRMPLNLVQGEVNLLRL